MTCKRANTVGPFRRVRPCPDPWQTGDFGGRLGWAAGCLHPTVHLYWPPLKHPRCLIHHQAISKRSLEYIGITHIRHIVKMFWAMKCPELAELWWISDIMMQGFRIVRLCARNPRNVCLTFPTFLASNPYNLPVRSLQTLFLFEFQCHTNPWAKRSLICRGKRSLWLIFDDVTLEGRDWSWPPCACLSHHQGKLHQDQVQLQSSLEENLRSNEVNTDLLRLRQTPLDKRVEIGLSISTDRADHVNTFSSDNLSCSVC